MTFITVKHVYGDVIIIYCCVALNSLSCADMPLRNYSLFESRITYKLCLIMHLKHTIRAPQYLADCVQTIAQSSSCPGLRSANTTTYVKPCTRTKFGDAAYTLSNLLHQTLVLPRAVEAHRAVQSRHSEWSFIGSRASSHVRPNRSRSFLLLKSMSLLDVLSSFWSPEGSSRRPKALYNLIFVCRLRSLH